MPAPKSTSRRKPPPARRRVPRPVIGRPPGITSIKHPPKAARRMTLPRPPIKTAPRPKAPARPLAGPLGVFTEPAPNATLLDLVDNLLGKGVVLHADVVLALADVDLVYLKLTALLAAADRIFGPQADRRARAAAAPNAAASPRGVKR